MGDTSLRSTQSKTIEKIKKIKRNQKKFKNIIKKHCKNQKNQKNQKCQHTTGDPRVRSNQSHYSTCPCPPQSEDPTQIQCFYLFSRPTSQQQPIPLLNLLLPTSVRGPNPNSVFLFVFPIHKSTATKQTKTNKKQTNEQTVK